MGFLWVKALHIVLVTAWFAGLFYLPRFYVNLAQNQSADVTACLLGMARRLYRFMHGLALLAIALGFVLYLGYGIGRGPGNGWLHAKLGLLVLLLGYHHGCGVLLRKFAAGRNTRSATFYRWFNEIPVLMLLAMVVLVVVKPF